MAIEADNSNDKIPNERKSKGFSATGERPNTPSFPELPPAKPRRPVYPTIYEENFGGTQRRMVTIDELSSRLK